MSYPVRLALSPDDFPMASTQKRTKLMAFPTKKGKVELKPNLSALFKAEEDPLLRYAFGLLGRRAVAEEVVQDAFLKLHEQYAEVEMPRPWLYRCVRNLCFNRIRKLKREDISDEPGEPDSGDREQPDEVLHVLESMGALRLVVAELEARDREILKMKYFQGLRYAEISDQLDMSVGNVGYRLHHILKHLEAALQKLGVTSL